MNGTLSAPVAGGNAPGRIRELDGWRAIAASTVLIGHFAIHAHARAAMHIPLLFGFLHFASYLAVQTFFIISGFIICRLLLMEERRYGSFSLRGFYMRRVLRILPPFYLYLATLAALAHFGIIVITIRQLAKAALFLVDFHSFSAPWPIGHAWSLSVEEQFYLFFPFILWLTAPRWRRTVLASICGVFIVIAITLATIHHILLFSSGIMVGFIGIFCGVLLALYEEHARAIVKKAPSILYILLATILLVLALADLHGLQGVLLQIFVATPATALLLLFTLERKSLFQSFLCWRPVVAIGTISYALYLWQQLFTGTSQNYSGVGRFIPYLLPLGVIIAALSWILVERHAIRLGKILSRRLRQHEESRQEPRDLEPIIATSE